MGSRGVVVGGLYKRSAMTESKERQIEGSDEWVVEQLKYLADEDRELVLAFLRHLARLRSSPRKP